MSIEIKDGAVLKDGENVGSIGPDGKFVPVDGLQWKRREAIEKFLADEAGKPPAEKPPEEIHQEAANGKTQEVPGTQMHRLSIPDQPEREVFGFTHVDSKGKEHLIAVEKDTLIVDGDIIGHFTVADDGKIALIGWSEEEDARNLEMNIRKLKEKWGDSFEEKRDRARSVAEVAGFDLNTSDALRDAGFVIGLESLYDRIFPAAALPLRDGVKSGEVFDSKSPEPIKDPQFGDLTPEWVEWFRANHSSEEFAAKYHHRGVY
ncbi:hypothetical protein TSACC_21702 [Terrimicrobium sacchariphilum]|uniref:Uncharacterized protein n=1 Tax=Terrimicrobium sacchariphilum TaxID=690879 RepID=A0A146G6A4_TERSA|nr:hypothetical protein [Terrimicrobium sacchariphilum]GAT33289.1 hypothetical protein TSACC_21702 [Terrimicrobium sacchariphilum]